MPYNLTSLRLRPIRAHWASLATVNGAVVPSGDATTPLNLTVGATTTLTVRITAQDNTTFLDYTVDVYRPFSHVCGLSALMHDAGSTLQPTFASATFSYNLAVGGGVATMVVSPIPLESTATMSVNTMYTPNGGPSPMLNITMGSTTMILIRVTAQDSISVKTYSISVYRPSQIADLLDIQPSVGALTPLFLRSVLVYTLPLHNAVAQLTLTPTLFHGLATMTLNGAAHASGTASSAFEPAEGATLD